MSHTALLWALKQPVAKQGAIRDALNASEEPPGLSTNESLILIRLADHHNGKSGKCFPKMDLLAEETGLARSTVQNAIAALCDFGLVSIDHTCAPPRRTRGAEKPVNGYRLHTDRRYGSIPMSGMAQDRPAVSNQEPNLEVPASPTPGTQPGTRESSSSGTDEAEGRARPTGSHQREAPSTASRQYTTWMCGSPAGCPCEGDPARLGYCLHPTEVTAEEDGNGGLRPIQVPDNVRPFRRRPA